MSSRCFQRARSPEQKAERRAEILQAAAQSIESGQFHSVALVDVARLAGVTKAALYRYFPSKEALFLALYLSELETLAQNALKPDTPLWKQMTDALTAQPLFCQLTAILHSMLEQNLDREQALAFKQTLLQHFSVLSARLQQHYGLSFEQVNAYLMQVQQSIIGCWIVSHPAPVIEGMLDLPPLDVFRVDFAAALGRQLKALEAAL